jgi:hypothetical protein
MRWNTENADSLAWYVENRLPDWDASGLGYYFDDAWQFVPNHRLSALQVTNADSMAAERARFVVFRDAVFAATNAAATTATILGNVGAVLYLSDEIDGITVETGHVANATISSTAATVDAPWYAINGALTGQAAVEAVFRWYEDNNGGPNVCWNCTVPYSICGTTSPGTQEAYPARSTPAAMAE